MGDWWVSIVIGIVEGLTEFLPVSSTGHMILAGHLIGFKGSKAESFEIIIQLGAILAVAVLYWKKILQLFKLGFPIRKSSSPQSRNQLNLLHIAIAIVPALGLAYIFRHFIKELFSPETVLVGLVLGGIFMIIAEKKQTEVSVRTIDELTYKQVFLIGLAQCLSLWPGFSRSGATIAGGMLAGANRAAAADFTFLIAIPVMVVATGYELLQNYRLMTMDDLWFFAVGFIVSFLVALMAVATFIKLVHKLKLTYFSYYRFILAAVFLIYILTSDLT